MEQKPVHPSLLSAPTRVCSPRQPAAAPRLGAGQAPPNPRRPTEAAAGPPWQPCRVWAGGRARGAQCRDAAPAAAIFSVGTAQARFLFLPRLLLRRAGAALFVERRVEKHEIAKGGAVGPSGKSSNLICVLNVPSVP